MNSSVAAVDSDTAGDPVVGNSVSAEDSADVDSVKIGDSAVVGSVTAGDPDVVVSRTEVVDCNASVVESVGLDVAGAGTHTEQHSPST